VGLKVHAPSFAASPRWAERCAVTMEDVIRTNNHKAPKKERDDSPEGRIPAAWWKQHQHQARISVHGDDDGSPPSGGESPMASQRRSGPPTQGRNRRPAPCAVTRWGGA